MSENKDPDLAKAFADWLENQTGEQRLKTEAPDFTQDKTWQQRQQTASFLAHQVELQQQAEVPSWDRASTFDTQNIVSNNGGTAAVSGEHRPWWQWQGLPALSLAFSCMAMAFVLLKVELVVQEQGVMLSFAGNQAAQQQQQFAQLIDQRLQTFASEQQVILANYAADIKVKQQESNLQLASYIMGASRQERKEDITDFIKYINAQRADEQFEQNLKFKQLEQALKYQQTKYTPRMQNLGSHAQPADWTTEEE